MTLILLSLGIFANAAQGTDKPNFVLIYADDVGFGDVGVNGSELIPTPNIDRLAREGLNFTDAHSPASTCTPSRFSLLTGVHAFRRKVRILPPNAPLIIPTDQTTLADVFQQAGYSTGIVGKWHLGLGKKGTPVDWNDEVKPGPLELGFDQAFLVPSTNDRVPCVYLEGHKVVNLSANDPLHVGRKLTDVSVASSAHYPDGATDRGAMTYYESSTGHDNSVINGIGRIGYMSGGKSALWDDETMADVLVKRADEHREWIYGYRDQEQIIRGKKVMRDGRGRWWDVANTPDDLISFREITDWNAVSAEHRTERDRLLAVLPRFDQVKHGKNAPGVTLANEPVAAKGDRPPTGHGSISQSWKFTFRDDYESRDEIGKDYTTARGHDDSWSVKDGVLVGKQTKDDHGAVIRTELDFDDVDIQFDFRFAGGKSFNFVIDDANDKSVHAGHICRASVAPKYLMISDDKTGAMNLEVRRQRQDKDLSPEATTALRELLDQTRSSAKVSINPNHWHRLRIRIRDDVMKAFLDDALITSLKSPGFAHPTKTKFGFTVNGQSIEFDNLQVRQLE